MKFLELGVDRKVVGNVENNPNMQFQPKIFTSSRENAKNLFWGDAYLSPLRAEISKLRNFQGKRMHLGGRVPETLCLDIRPKPWISFDSEITGFENRMILLKIDLKWPQNG